jgi:long-chain acyl-CoA synthetase
MVAQRVVNFASGLVGIGCEPKQHIGIFSRNRPEWVIAEQASYAHNMVVVALYDTLGPDSVSYILNHAAIGTVICTQDKIKKILDVAEQCPQLKRIIQIESQGNKDLLSLADKKGVKLYSFAEIEAQGALKPTTTQPATADDIATIMYTSGTTGVPKGVVLLHRNCMAAVASSYMFTKHLLDSSDSEISFLPMAHIFERVLQGIVFALGASIGFFQGVRTNSAFVLTFPRISKNYLMI